MTDAESLSITATLPKTAADPIVIYDSHTALRPALVERDFVGRLGDDSGQPGNYILQDRPADDGKWGC